LGGFEKSEKRKAGKGEEEVRVSGQTQKAMS
jgi:hypothetical protein